MFFGSCEGAIQCDNRDPAVALTFSLVQVTSMQTIPEKWASKPRPKFIVHFLQVYSASGKLDRICAGFYAREFSVVIHTQRDSLMFLVPLVSLTFENPPTGHQCDTQVWIGRRDRGSGLSPATERLGVARSRRVS